MLFIIKRTIYADLNVTCFLTGGPLINVMWRAGGFRSFDEMLREANSPSGIHPRCLQLMNDALSNCRGRISHTGFVCKCKKLGPPADHPESSFLWDKINSSITVSDYFVEMGKINPKYNSALTKGKLKFPKLPTVNVGSTSKPTLVPVELVEIFGGQSRSNRMNGEMCAKMIKYAAVKPDERQKAILGRSAGSPESVIDIIRTDITAHKFGLSDISQAPIAVNAILLPQAKLEYRGGRIVDPGLSGAWKIRTEQVIRPPRSSSGGDKVYGVVLVSGSGPPCDNWASIVSSFERKLLEDFRNMGIVIRRGGEPMPCSDREADMSRVFGAMRSADILFVVLNSPCYDLVKFVAESRGILTQCMKWRNLEQIPSGYCSNVALKVIKCLFYLRQIFIILFIFFMI